MEVSRDAILFSWLISSNFSESIPTEEDMR